MACFLAFAGAVLSALIFTALGAVPAGQGITNGLSANRECT